MGDILRSEIANKGKAEDKWSMIGDLVSKGEMAPEVGNTIEVWGGRAYERSEGGGAMRGLKGEGIW